MSQLSYLDSYVFKQMQIDCLLLTLKKRLTKRKHESMKQTNRVGHRKECKGKMRYIILFNSAFAVSQHYKKVPLYQENYEQNVNGMGLGEMICDTA